METALVTCQFTGRIAALDVVFFFFISFEGEKLNVCSVV